MQDQSHNLNAPPVCQLARVILGKEYSEQGGGTMTFWKGLSDHQHRIFQLALNEAMRKAIRLNLTLEEMIDEDVR